MVRAAASTCACSTGRGTAAPRNPRFLRDLVGLVRRERPDVVHLLSNNTLWLNLALPFLPAPVVTTVHDVEVHPGDAETGVLPRWATDLAVRQSGDVVVHGPGLRRAAIARFGKPADRVHVLPHPAIGALCRRSRGARGSSGGRRGFTVLLFGRHLRLQGPVAVPPAEALVGDRIPGLRVVIAGRGDDPAALSGLMGDPGRYDIRHRFIEDREVAQLFLDADVVALPYVEASQSGVLNVAAAFGKPVVVTDVGELRATVEPNGLGLVVPPRDPQALADALVRLAAEPRLRRARSGRGRWPGPRGRTRRRRSAGGGGPLRAGRRPRRAAARQGRPAPPRPPPASGREGETRDERRRSSPATTSPAAATAAAASAASSATSSTPPPPRASATPSPTPAGRRGRRRGRCRMLAAAILVMAARAGDRARSASTMSTWPGAAARCASSC